MAITKEMKNALAAFGDYGLKGEKPSKSQRIENLPSDTALESNKERQDAEMKSGLAKIGKAMIPGGGGILIAEEMLKRRQKDEGETASGLPREARGMKKGGKVKKMAAGGSASKRADGCAVRGKTRGKMV